MELSTLSQASISLPFITATQDGPKHIDTNLSRAKFEDMCSDLLDRCGRSLVRLSVRHQLAPQAVLHNIAAAAAAGVCR